MNKIRFYFTALTLSALPCALAAAPMDATAAKPSAETNTSSSFKVNYSLKPDGREWKEAANESVVQNLAGGDINAKPDNVLFRVRKYVLANEASAETPQEAFVLEKLVINPEDEAGSDKEFITAFFKGFSEELEKESPNVKFEKKIISQDDHSLLAKWSTESPMQHGWFREIKNGRDIAVLIYVTGQEKNLDETEKNWLEILNNASISPDEVDTEDKEPSTVK
jgi:hypothetical protein